MQITFSIDTLERVGELAESILDRLSKADELRPRSMRLRDYDPGEIPDEKILEVAARDARGGIELIVPAGEVSLSWRYGPTSWFQLVHGEIRVERDVPTGVVDAVADLSEMLSAAYSIIDVEDLVSADLLAYSSEGSASPLDRLDDLYWYNYYGPDLSRVLRREHGLTFDVPEVSQRQLARGWEVRVDGPPRSRPYPPALRKYLNDAGVFRKYTKRARFKSGRIEFDYSKVREKKSKADWDADFDEL